MTQSAMPGVTIAQEQKPVVANSGEQAPKPRAPAHDSSILDAILTETEKYRNALEPTTGEEAWLEAQRVFKSGMCGVQSVEDAYIRIKTGRTLGMGSMASVQGIDVIEMRPSLKAATMVALCQSRPDKVEYFRMLSTSDDESEWEAKRVNDPPIKFKYTIAMAERAGLTTRGKDAEANKKSNWYRHPASMLRARASAQLARIVANDVLLGFPSSEEMDDVRNERLEAEGVRNMVPTAHATPIPSVPARDFQSEAALIAHDIGQCESMTALKALNPKISKFVEEAPEADANLVKGAYNKVRQQLQGNT